MFARLARWCFHRRLLTVGIWLVVLAGIGVIGNVVVGSDYSSEFQIPASESASGFEVLNEAFGENGGSGQSGSVVFRAEAGVEDPAVQAAMSEYFAEVDELPGVGVVSPYDPNGIRQIDPSGTIAYATVNLSQSLGQTETMELGAEIAELAPELEGLQVEIGGVALAEFEPPEAELIGLAFAIVILIVAF
ncbi:hypothetical protein BH23ACT3_BH23ACT3_13730 [soil metagenome]